jgi:hypothetical protein
MSFQLLPFEGEFYGTSTPEKRSFNCGQCGLLDTQKFLGFPLKVAEFAIIRDTES